MKTKSVNYKIILFGVLFSLIYSCIKKEAFKTNPSVTILSVTNITSTSASSRGVITADGGARYLQWGFAGALNKIQQSQKAKQMMELASVVFQPLLIV